MLPLRYRRLWSIAGGFVLLGVLAAAVAPTFWWPSTLPTGVGLDKWLHAATFCVLALWFSGQFTRRAYWRIALSLFLFGLLIELFQRTLVYRTGDVYDLMANVTGIALGLLIAFFGMGGWSLRIEAWLAARASP